MKKKLTNRRLSSKKVLLAAASSQLADVIVVGRRHGEVTVFGAPPTNTRDDYDAVLSQLQDGIALIREVRDCTFTRAGNARSTWGAREL